LRRYVGYQLEKNVDDIQIVNKGDRWWWMPRKLKVIPNRVEASDNALLLNSGKQSCKSKNHTWRQLRRFDASMGVDEHVVGGWFISSWKGKNYNKKTQSKCKFGKKLKPWKQKKYNKVN